MPICRVFSPIEQDGRNDGRWSSVGHLRISMNESLYRLHEVRKKKEKVLSLWENICRAHADEYYRELNTTIRTVQHDTRSAEVVDPDTIALGGSGGV